jgi:isohexenylglutaconyl-CoA hydratase
MALNLPTSVQLADDDGVLRVTLARPDVRNALSMEMVEALREVFQYAETRGDLRALVLRGSGGHFCAGADVKDLASARARPRVGEENPVSEVNAAFGHLCDAFASLSLPTLCVLQGSVLGGGFGLCCAADVALADDTARFGLPETSLGVVPAQIAPFLVERLGYAEAKRLALLGGRIDAAEARALGLVHAVFAPGEALEAGLDATLTRLFACAPQATRATKRLFLRMRTLRPSDHIAYAANVFADAVMGAEGTEGTLAFLQKRSPSWQTRKAKS